MAITEAIEQESDTDLFNPRCLVDRCMGNVALVQRLLTNFADLGRQDCDQLEMLLRAGDLSSLGAVAHRLKGSSATIGSNRMSTLASLIEKESKSMDWATLESMVAEIREVQNEVSDRCLQSADTYQFLTENGGDE